MFEPREQLRNAIVEYLKFECEKNVGSALLNFETLREFLMEADDEARREQEVCFSRNFSTQIPVQI